MATGFFEISKETEIFSLEKAGFKTEVLNGPRKYPSFQKNYVSPSES
jgi:hypothetical protein